MEKKKTHFLSVGLIVSKTIHRDKLEKVPFWAQVSTRRMCVMFGKMFRSNVNIYLFFCVQNVY